MIKCVFPPVDYNFIFVYDVLIPFKSYGILCVQYNQVSFHKFIQNYVDWFCTMQSNEPHCSF